MNILVATDSVFPITMGGSHRVVFEFCNALVDAGHRVRCVVPTDGKTALDSVKSVRFEIVTYQKGVSKFAKALTFFLGARAALKQQFSDMSFPIDAVSIQFLPTLAAFLLMSRRPFYYVFYGPHSSEVVGQFLGRWRSERRLGHLVALLYAKLFLAPLERWLLSRGKFPVVVLSDFSARLASRFGVSTERLIKVPGAADTELFRPSPEGRRRLRAALRCGEDTILVISVRRLEPRMGLDVLVNAMALLPTTEHRLRLMIGGKGSQQEVLADLIRRHGLADRVQMLGFIPEGELPDYYSAADLFIMPSQSDEGFGLPVLEAAACGLPVAATPGGGHSELVAQIAPQCVMPGLLAADMAAFLAKVASGAISLPDGAAMRNFAIGFSWEKFTAAQVSIMQELAHAHGEVAKPLHRSSVF